MKPGKLPADLLRRLLASHPATDPRVLLGPSVGEDAAVLDMGGRALVVATDPITFTADLIGWCAVQVNANDVATRGAVPRWFMATVLLPKDASETLAESIFSQITDACSELGVSLIGGHTEITLGIDRPIVVGAMLGEAAPDRLVYTSGARPGDAILLTKGIAIEGTAILAREAPQALLDAGVGMATLESAGAYLSTQGIGITREALAAVGAAPVHAMHDPTEGGLATALSEMAEAAGVGVQVDLRCIPVLPECARICEAMKINPLGLLASGALLIALPVSSTPLVADSLAAEGVNCTVIGCVTEKSEGLVLTGPQGPTPLPTFERDELARVLERLAGE